MSKSEELRRKDVCVSCNRFTPIKAKNMCQNCWHKYKRKNHPEFFLRTRYTEIKQRCQNPKNRAYNHYKHCLICTREEFLCRFRDDPIFLNLFDNWKKSNYNTKLTPSVDRIDTKKGYTLDNMQFLTHSDNCTKDQEKTPIKYFKEGKLLGEFSSQGEASRVLGIPQSNIWKVLVKQRKTAGGYHFEYL